MEKKADFFQKKLSNTRSFVRQKKTTRKWMWVLIGLISLSILGLVGWKLFWEPVGLDGVKEQTSELSLGEDVFLQGEIRANGDIITHTHTIEDEKYGIIGIKSDLINLGDYSGIVSLTGTVEKFYQGNPIVKVLQLSGNRSDAGDTTDIVLDDNSGVYLMHAGIQFLPSFFDEYVLLNEGENGEIRIQNIETGKEIVLNYFRCNSSDPNRNCKGLSETFANSSAQSFVTSEGDVYYKQNEAQSWFVSNGDRWGIFINDVSDDIVFELKDLMKFANKKNMDGWIKNRAMRICQGSGEKMQNISNSEISLKQEGLIVTVSGNGIEKQMTCQILVDFSLPAKGVLQSLTIGDEVVIQEEIVEQSQEIQNESPGQSEEKPSHIADNSQFDTNVAQFPIKEEGLVYNSNRGGYSLHFPSSNISYSVSSVKENFGRSDVSCSYVINVIKYTEKENLEISPAVRIYECTGGVDKSWAPDIVVYPRAGKKFVIKMNDGAWYDFSTNLKIETIESEG